MSNANQFAYIDSPKTKTPPFLDESVDLQKIYSTCLQELALQQSKRDQLITFYLTITGLVSTYLFSKEVDFKVCIAIFAGLFGIGWIWTTIAMRYKTYKDIYWMCCKTISSLFSADLKHIDKACVQHTFYSVMQKCYKSVPKNDKGKPMILKYALNNLSSAEYLLFLTLVLLSAMAGSAFFLMIFLKIGFGKISYLLVALFFIAIVAFQTIRYSKSCIAVFKAVEDKSDKSFNKVFEKAWFLHFFL